MYIFYTSRTFFKKAKQYNYFILNEIARGNREKYQTRTKDKKYLYIYTSHVLFKEHTTTFTK